MRVRLVSLDGLPDIVVSQTSLLVGRHAHCDVRIDSSHISRRHCFLVLENGTLTVRDLDSTNGTWVNGERIMHARMVPGDQLIIGHAQYRLECGQENETDRPGPGPARGPQTPQTAELEGTWLMDRPVWRSTKRRPPRTDGR